MPAQNPCPNPKCGSNDVWSTSAGHDFWIYCNKCLLTGPIAESECAAIDVWDSLPRMHSIIAWQFQAAGLAFAMQRLMSAAQAMREAQQAYEQYGSNEDSMTEAEAVFDGLLADVRMNLEEK